MSAIQKISVQSRRFRSPGMNPRRASDEGCAAARSGSSSQAPRRSYAHALARGDETSGRTRRSPRERAGDNILPPLPERPWRLPTRARGDAHRGGFRPRSTAANAVRPRGVVCVARARARARSRASRVGRVVFPRSRNAGAGVLRARATAGHFSSDAGAWRGEAQRCDAAAAGRRRSRVRTPHAHRDATRAFVTHR